MSEALAVQVETLEKMIESGDLAGALDFLEALSQEERAQWQIQNLTGVVCAYCGQFREAEHFFTAALAQKPDDENILYNLKDTQAALEQLKQAEEKGGEPAAGTKKRVLMAAYYFPPLSGSGVFRSIKFAKYLPLYGWQPTVISTDRPPNGWNFADESQVAEIPKDMEVIRIPDGISTGRETSLENSRAQAVLGFLRDILRLSPEADGIFAQYLQSAQGIRNLLTFPCGALCWAYDVVQYIEKNLDLSKFDAIYTTSGPSSAHLIGFYLKRNYGIAWVADYRDPWTDNPYGGYNPAIPYYKMLFELERLLLQQADCNLTVEESLVKTYMDHFGLPQEKIQCITNGYDEEDFVSLVLPEKRSDKFTVTYSGLIYTKQQIVGFRAFLEAVQQLCKTKKMDRSDFCFYLAGEADRNTLDLIHRFGLGDSVRKDSFQAHSNVLQCNLNSDLLLLLVGDEAKQKPVYTGKFFEYLRSGRPILALAPKGGAVARVLRETGHGESFLSTQVGQIKAMILREYRKWQSGEPAELLRAPAIARFERKELTRQLAEVLDFARNCLSTEILEIPSGVYDAGYRQGGPVGSYHNHYSRSIYYSGWEEAMSFLYLLDREIPILEIGCGPGQFANMLFDYGFTNYTGFDYAVEGITLAKKNNPNHADHFFVADAFQTELMEDQYGLVICFEVLEHIQKDLELIQHIQPGTKMLLSVPNFNDPYHVRFFRTAEEVCTRYSAVMDIYYIRACSIQNSSNCIYYVVGKKT